MTVHQLRKEGKLKEAWQRAQEQFSKSPESQGNVLELTWVYYDFLKRETANGNTINFFKVCDKLSEIKLTNNDKMIKEQLTWSFYMMLRLLTSKPNNNAGKIQQLVEYYKQIIGFDNPSLPQSLLIKSLLKVKLTIPHIWKLLPWFHTGLLREEDFLMEEYNQQKIMPLAERVFYTYAKGLINDAKNEYEEAVLHLEEFIQECEADSLKRDYAFADYYLAEASILTEDFETASKYALQFIQRNHLKSWAWSLLSRTCKDKSKQVVYMSMAISLEINEAYLLPVRAALNENLIETGQFKAAAQNTRKMISLRNKNGWSLPAKLIEIQASNWYRNLPDGENLDAIIGREAGKALKLVFPEVDKELVLVIANNKKKFKLLALDGAIYNYKTAGKLSIGDWLSISHVNKKILNHKKSSSPATLNGKIRSFNGSLKMKTNFGFVNNVFIPPQLIEKESIRDQHECHGLAIFINNPKTNRESWRAITLKKDDQ